MMKKLTLIIVLLIISLSLFSKGVKDEFQAVEGNASWNYNLDLSSYKEGKYNLVVKSEDASGNSTISKGKNFVISAKSDMPKVNVILPKQNFYATDNFLLFGGCYDDDGTSDLFITVDDLQPYKISTDRYWGKNIDIANLEDGAHTISIKPVDKNGVDGDVKILNFYVDKIKPEFSDVAISPKANSNVLLMEGNIADVNGIKSVSYSVDGGISYKKINYDKKVEDGKNKFSFSIPFKGLNFINLILKAEDSAGRSGYWAKKIVFDGGYVVSEIDNEFSVEKRALSNPKIELVDYNETKIYSGTITLKGKVSGSNKIKDISISFDRGDTFHSVSGVDKWEYQFNTNILDDGIYQILIRAEDELSLTSDVWTVTVIDNSAPEIEIKLPSLNGVYTKNIPIAAVIKDQNKISQVVYSLYSISKNSFIVKDVKLEVINGVAQSNVDGTNLPKGDYIFTVVATDSAGNRAEASSVCSLNPIADKQSVEILFPTEGKKVTPPFAIEGKTEGLKEGSKINILFYGDEVASATTDKNGYFSVYIDDYSLNRNDLKVVATVPGTKVTSASRMLFLEKSGPFIKINNLKSGDVIFKNITVKGEAGWNDIGSKNIGVKKVRVSFDNGLTYKNATGKNRWSFRLNTFKLKQGTINFLVRVDYSNGLSFSENKILLIDTVAPEAQILNFQDKKEVNTTQLFQGASVDNSEIEKTYISVREGSTVKYEVPPFFDMLYLDLNFLGATYFQAGLGLALFNNNIRIQFSTGISPNSFANEDTRFYGFVLGGKILARLYEVEFGNYFGPDYDFLSLGFYLGAGVSWFSMTDYKNVKFDKGVVLAAGLGQVELSFDVPNTPVFNRFGLYGEFSLWFVSSDIQAKVIPSGSIGLKVGIL